MRGRFSRISLRAAALLTSFAAITALAATGAYGFPWSTDMFVGAAVQPLAMAPRVMPEGTLPMDGVHYNHHYGQPGGLGSRKPLLPMKLELMTVRLQNPLKATPLNLAHGKALFETVCAPCHGIHGRGNGTVVHLLQHKPADLLTGVSINLPDGYFFGYIRNGGIWMPSYDDAMSETERWQIVLYVRQLEKEYGGTKPTAQQTAAANQPSVPKGGVGQSGPFQPNKVGMPVPRPPLQGNVGPYNPNVITSGRNPAVGGISSATSQPGLFQPGLGESGTNASLGSQPHHSPDHAGNSGAGTQ